MAALLCRVRAAASGAGNVTILEGPAGIEKTRMLAEAIAAGTGWGWAITLAAASEFDELAPPETLVASLGLNPEERGRNQATVMLDPRLWLLDRARRELEDRCHRRPLLIVLDDIQWADPVTLLLLNALPAQLTGRPIAWVLAYRSAEAPPDG